MAVGAACLVDLFSGFSLFFHHQLAARYMLVQHRDVVQELFHHGHINEREFEGLITQNNTARVRLDYHPLVDQIPDRCGNNDCSMSLRYAREKLFVAHAAAATASSGSVMCPVCILSVLGGQ